jgi:catechol 2,3-dioxygenase-like lactoylglutathione lyase family enzyme
VTPPFCQIAVSVFDLERTLDWYRAGFGFLPAGGRRGGGPVVASLQGLPCSSFEVAWLVDRQECFQLEIFRFDEPAPRPLERAPVDIGYTTLAIHVDDFDRALQRLATLGSEPLTAPHGGPGTRRACVRDPDGVYVELLEDDPREPGVDRRSRPRVPSVVRSVSASVPDLARARLFWEATVGLRAVPGVELHGGKAGGKRVLLWGQDIALELIEHADPRGRGWPDGYRISDQGIVNVAIGGPGLETYEDVLGRTRRGGYRHHPEAELPGARAVYLEDDQGFSLELLYRSAATAATAGFVPLEP